MLDRCGHRRADRIRQLTEATAIQKYDSLSPASNALPEVKIVFDSAGTEAIPPLVYNAEFTDGDGADDADISYSLTDGEPDSDDARLVHP